MISRRLVAAIAVQVAAGAALATALTADPFWPMEECSEEVNLNEWVCTGTEIQWGPDDWTAIANGFLCESSGWSHEEFWTEDTDDEGLPDAMESVREECEMGGAQPKLVEWRAREEFKRPPPAPHRRLF